MSMQLPSDIESVLPHRDSLRLIDRVVELARTGPLRNAVLARRKSDDERKRSRVAPVVATKPVLGDYTHRLNVG